MPGLYKKEDFKDNCGFGLVSNIDGIKSHKVITNSINALTSMTHRGGVGSDGKTGDGCGLLFDIDHDYFRNAVSNELDIKLPEIFAVGQLFFNNKIEDILPEINKILKNEKLSLSAIRKVPVEKNILGKIALDCSPNIYQLFISPSEKAVSYTHLRAHET